MTALPAGGYIPGSSPIHRLDPRAKLLALFVLLAGIILTETVLGYAFMVLFILEIILLSKLNLKSALGPIRRMLPFFIIIFLMNAVFLSGEGAYFNWWIFHPSPAGMLRGLNVVMRVVLLIVLSNILTSTTAPMELTSALQSLIRPLGLLHIPVDEIAMIISVAIQFIPVLFEETDMIKKAQTARGAKFDSPRLLDKAGSILPLAIPIFIAAFRRADELSLAMEARGYRGAKNRSKKRGRFLTLMDYCTLLCCTAVCLAQIFIF
ncbi:MAG: energy-coupling factor transporter transmembrane protein EcfT [Oscillospiraceae bacterium]